MSAETIVPLEERTIFAMGGGGFAMSHVNDAGYWIFTKLAGLSVADGLRTWTLLVTILGTLGFLMTLAIG